MVCHGIDSLQRRWKPVDIWSWRSLEDLPVLSFCPTHHLRLGACSTLRCTDRVLYGTLTPTSSTVLFHKIRTKMTWFFWVAKISWDMQNHDVFLRSGHPKRLCWTRSANFERLGTKRGALWDFLQYIYIYIHTVIVYGCTLLWYVYIWRGYSIVWVDIYEVKMYARVQILLHGQSRVAPRGNYTVERSVFALSVVLKALGLICRLWPG